MELPEELWDALERTLAGTPVKQLASAVDRLTETYRGAPPTDRAVIRTALDVAAYAAYRMPATFAAARFALREFALLAGDWQPGSHVDVGGGTGAATWAVAETWPSVQSSTVVDWAEPTRQLGRQLAQAAAQPSVREAQWVAQEIGPEIRLPDADLVTMSYVLNELTPEARTAVVAEMAARGQVVAIIEAGTPEGYRRVLEARAPLIEAGLSVVAPCPHDLACPISAQDDWCHFAARVNRSATHRQIKGGSLSYEDEKFAYVIASRIPFARAAGRVLRHPQRGKKIVQFPVCAEVGEVVRTTVTKSQGETYRQAKDVAWGNAWPPVEK
ncbi:MAG TPA: small ribosomal subunit Rsm22 family protein [Actinocrinis sp.]|nr:small ribosomal subunit Rsm22 family protein [Actinocrinis sp.]